MALIFRRKRIWAEVRTEIREQHRVTLEEASRDEACQHPQSEFRRLRTSNGTFQLRKQCLSCGELIGSAYKRETVRDFDALPLVDEFARQRAQNQWQDRQALSQQAQAEEQSAFWEYYNEHLQSPEWREKCELKMSLTDGLCEGCGKERARHIHHRTYENLGDEFLFELVALCLICHQKIHPHREIA